MTLFQNDPDDDSPKMQKNKNDVKLYFGFNDAPLLLAVVDFQFY